MDEDNGPGPSSGPYHVPDHVPALVGERLEQGEHRVPDVVEVEVPRVRPDQRYGMVNFKPNSDRFLNRWNGQSSNKV